MFTLLCIICVLGIAGNILRFGLKAAWGISKLLLTGLILPVILLAFIISGLLTIAVPVLIVLGVAGLVLRR